MRSLRLWQIGAMLVSIFCVSTIAGAADGLLFRYKVTKGEKLRFEINMDVKQSQSVAGMQVDSTFETKETVQREAQNVDEKGQAEWRLKYEQLQAKISVGPLGEYKYDSKSTDNEKGSLLGGSLTPLYDAMSGAVVDITVTPRGEVTKVKGLKEVLDGVLKDNPLAAQFAGGAQSEEGAKLTYQANYVEFPEKPLTVGEQWEVPYKLNLPNVGKGDGTTRCTYVGPKTVDGKEVHEISYTTELTMDVDLETGGAKVTGKVRTTNSTGKALFDAAAGRLVANESEVTTKGELTVTMNGAAIPVTQDQTNKHSVKLVSADANR